ncbi:MAG: DUF4956 domain-containing protein [Myxococcales bacterium]|nr:DUF4956 domain-containing protein [Myxococcales bacterium]
MEPQVTMIVHALESLLPRLGLDLVCAWVLVQGIYVRLYPRREYVFTYWMLNLITFSVAYVLAGVRVEMGLSLGLFAVFGILRYRTEAMRIRDLTYLFVIIGMAILNGVANTAESLLRVALIDGTVLAVVALLEMRRQGSTEDTMVVRYDRIELLQEGQRDALLADLSKRLGVECLRVGVEQVDLMHDSAEVVVSFRRRGGLP